MEDATSNEPSPLRHWTKADFLHRAQELKRRLEVWDVDDNEFVYCPKDVVALMKAERQVFRDMVMLGEHDPNPSFKTWNLVANFFIPNPKNPYSKYITTWEFREFVEHLVDAGDSEEARLIRLKVERLLDCPMHIRSRNEVFGDFIAGRPIEQPLLDEFLEAVKVFSSSVSVDEVFNRGGEAKQSVAREVVPPHELELDDSLDPSIKNIVQTFSFDRQIDTVLVGKQVANSVHDEGDPPKDAIATPVKTTSAQKSKTKLRRRGDAQVLLKSTLVKHHGYNADGSISCWEPVGSAELADNAEVGRSSTQAFWKKWFGDYSKYQVLVANKSPKLFPILAQLAGDNAIEAAQLSYNIEAQSSIAEDD